MTGHPAETQPAREVQVAGARIVWRAAEDLDAVAPTLDAVLRAGDRPAACAAKLCAELPPELLARFVPVLRSLTEHTDTFRDDVR